LKWCTVFGNPRVLVPSVFSISCLLLLSACGGTVQGAISTPTTPTVNTAKPPQILSFTASPTAVKNGELATLTWQTSDTVSVAITPAKKAEDNQPLPVSGSTTELPSATTTYTLTATNATGSVSATVTVNVTEPAPTLTFTAAPASIIAGQPATLTWTSQNATSISIDNGVGSVTAPSGARQVSPMTTATYTAAATGPGGTVTATATVTVQQQ
jgi:hypothetical protein